MKGEEIEHQIAARRTPEHHFISWWRREEDWLDVELLDTYLQNVKQDEEVEGFRLMDMDEMWELVRKVAGPRVARRSEGTVDMVYWKRTSGREMSCLYSPESLIRIFDVETRGNFVDG